MGMNVLERKIPFNGIAFQNTQIDVDRFMATLEFQRV